MRRALALALTTTLAMPATAAAADSVKTIDLSARPAIHKALVALKRVRHARVAERERRRERARRAQQVTMPAYLASIAQCESGGNPAAVGGGGTYRGLFQFDLSTWQSVGGQGDPAAAPVAEQIKRAEILYARSGAGQWPVCGA